MFNYRVISVILLVLSLAFVACEKDEEKDSSGGKEAVCLDQCGGEEAGTVAGMTAGTEAGMTAGTDAGMTADAVAGMTAGMTAGTVAGAEAGTVAGMTAGMTAGQSAGEESQGGQVASGEEASVAGEVVLPESDDMGSASEESDMGV
jgi:hypothetical protein